MRRAITVPEGLTSKAAAEIIDAEPALVGDAPAAPEGALLPDTYDVKLGETRADVVARMRKARDVLLARLWADRAPGLPYATPEQPVTLASIVEKETTKPSERPRIAAIFVHRLEKGMRLESDPTIIYGLTGGAPLGHGLRVSELASDTPYNTYKITGLRRRRSETRAAPRSRPRCIRRRARISISSRTAPADMCSHRPTKSTCGMSPNGGRSSRLERGCGGEDSPSFPSPPAGEGGPRRGSDEGSRDPSTLFRCLGHTRSGRRDPSSVGFAATFSRKGEG